jgi:predicted metal-dependent HD superfamily phosphohydrolase
MNCYIDNRYYHNINHIIYCLEKLEAFKQLADCYDEIAFALWFHDSRASEIESAEYAVEMCKQLSIPEDFGNAVYDLILATQHKDVPKSNDEKLLCDIDLLILAEQQDEFNAYEKNIRKEYKHVPIKEFKTGRKAILGRFLKREYIFHTEEMRKQFEGKARENLERSCKHL